MAEFDPDAYLGKSGFDPDAYLGKNPVRLGAVPPENVSPTDGMGRFQRYAAGLGKSMSDVGVAAKQRLDEAAAGLEAMVPGGASISSLFGKTAADIKREGQATITEQKRLDAPLMKDPYGIAGNISGAIGTGAIMAPLGPVGMGMGMGALTPTTEGQGEVLTNMAIGGAAGYAGDKAVKGLARLVQPKVDPNVQKLLAENIRLTPGQVLGGFPARLESKSTSLPFVGDAIAAAQKRGGIDLNKAAFDRALSPIGVKLPNGLMGREAVEFADDALGAAYNRILPKMTTQADATFGAEIGNLKQMMSTGAVDQKYKEAFDRIVNARVLDKFQGQSAMTGETMKSVESHLGKEASRFRRAGDPDANLMADAIQEVQKSLRGLVMRSNPQYADELQKINTGWANFKRVQRASAGLGTDEGMFTAAQLESAVKALDRSKDKARFAEGNALMQDLSGPAKAIMGSKYPDSGSAGRAMNAMGLLSYFAHPGIPAGLLTGAAGYTPPVQNMIVKAMTARPEMAPMIANEIRALSPMGGLLGATGALQP